ncbi:hypothetical protein V2G26_008255 [Clonostachys chloroleuca]|uniref:Uncharacterized protein n=1 Tax=Clonostachys chloroleuca TaxID=1926264 RepID=A0AA35VTE6_9HYPO|nr:unnamed protein product [Clonostachys chloroleuca]
MAPQAKANYKSYEAQARLIRAIVAAHPEVKWNYKEIVASFGSDMTEDALNHRFRRLRAEAVIIRHGRDAGFDMKHLSVEDLPKTQATVQKNNISQYFGQSTPDGIQFQFRTIKKDADHLRKVKAAGGDVANCLPSGGSVTSTPTKRTPSKATPSKGSRPRASAKRGHGYIKEEDSAIEEESEDFSELDQETPSKRQKTVGRKSATPSRQAASRAAATIAADAAVSYNPQSSVDSLSEGEPSELVHPNGSIFGAVEKKPDPRALDSEAFSRHSVNPYIGGDDMNDSLYADLLRDGGDGEI